jgi:hypothetical protein
MAQKAEQVGHEPFPVPRRTKRYLKRVTARKRRRVARRNPENAEPSNRYDGWAT